MALVQALDYLHRLQRELNDTRPLIQNGIGDLIKHDDWSNIDEFLAVHYVSNINHMTVLDDPFGGPDYSDWPLPSHVNLEKLDTSRFVQLPLEIRTYSVGLALQSLTERNNRTTIISGMAASPNVKVLESLARVLEALLKSSRLKRDEIAVAQNLHIEAEDDYTKIVETLCILWNGGDLLDERGQPDAWSLLHYEENRDALTTVYHIIDVMGVGKDWFKINEEIASMEVVLANVQKKLGHEEHQKQEATTMWMLQCYEVKVA